MKNYKLVKGFFAAISLTVMIAPLEVFLEPVAENHNQSYERVIYDQRQNGKYNIQVSIKDVAIIEMGSNDVEEESAFSEDYYYDDADLTVKPHDLLAILSGSESPSTSTQANTEAAPATTWPAIHHSSNSNLIPFGNLSNAGADADVDAGEAVSDNEKSYEGFTRYPSRSESMKIISPNQPESKARPTRRPNHGSPLSSQGDGKSISHIPIEDSRIYKLKILKTIKNLNQKPSQQPHRRATIPGKHCRANQYRDASGNCQSKRSSSIL